MKLQFDATQDYQLKAIEAVTDLFRGQSLNEGGFDDLIRLVTVKILPTMYL